MLAMGLGVSHSSEAHTSFDLEKQLRLAPGKWWVENPLSYFDFQRPACWKRRKQLPAGAGRGCRGNSSAAHHSLRRAFYR